MHWLGLPQQHWNLGIFGKESVFQVKLLLFDILVESWTKTSRNVKTRRHVLCSVYNGLGCVHQHLLFFIWGYNWHVSNTLGTVCKLVRYGRIQCWNETISAENWRICQAISSESKKQKSYYSSVHKTRRSFFLYWWAVRHHFLHVCSASEILQCLLLWTEPGFRSIYHEERDSWQ